jgi:3-oxoacyl-[acyl-carrier-protein] synthase II
MPATATNFQRVVITGLGAFTPLGPDLPATWRRLVAGEDAARPVTVFDVSGCRCKIGGQVDLPSHRRRSRASLLALPAAREALQDAGLLGQLDRLPLSVSTTAGGMELGQAFMRAAMGLVGQASVPVGPQAGTPVPRGKYFQISRYPSLQQVLDLQSELGFCGPSTIIANACASGANAIGHARDLIRAGRAEVVLSGGFEPLTELIYVGFDCLQALSTDRCRPFDTQRSGLMLGEAGAFLVLESETHARRRGARILCELAGYGHTTDLHHLTQPNPGGESLMRAMRIAFDDAGLGPADIGYVNAHGTATPLNDASEGAAFAAIFQNGARISSTKAAIGHTLGAAGSVEAVFTIQALVTGALPPQINLRTPEPAVAGKLVAPGETNKDMRAAMSVNLGFGGSNAALIFQRYER